MSCDGLDSRRRENCRPDADPGGIGEVEAYYESHESEHGVSTHVVYLASAGFRPVDVRVAMVEGEPWRLT